MSFLATPASLNRRAELYNQLGSMVAAGVTLIKALQMAAKSPALRGNRRIFLQLIDRLQAGHTFADSMSGVQGWMSDFDQALLSAGEQSGRLDVSFKLLGSYYASRASILRDMISAMIQSILTLLVFLLIFPLGLLVSFASAIVANEPGALFPFILEKTLVFGGIIGMVVLLAYLCHGRRGAGWRAVLESFYKRIPLLGRGLQCLVLSRVAVALESLLNAGVNVIQAWGLATAAGGSQHLVAAVADWGREMEAGMTPAELVARTPYFSGMFADLYHTGEVSGQLDDSLKRLQVYYEEEGFRLLRRFTRTLSGLLYGLVVLLVGYNVIKFWLHYYGALLNNS